MTELALDTHKFVKRLMESGFTEPQAETLADAQMAFLESRLASKEELRAVHEGLKAEIAELRSEMHGEISALRAEMQAEFAAVRAEMQAEFAAVRAEMTELRSEFSVMLIRSQIATGAAIITILSFINYLTG